jgi:hypothetical protein
MPTIILQIPPLRVILSDEYNERCSQCGQRQHCQNETSEEEMKVEPIKEEMNFQYPVDEEDDLSNFIIPNDVNLNQWTLSPTSEAKIKSELHDWEQFPIE